MKFKSIKKITVALLFAAILLPSFMNAQKNHFKDFESNKLVTFMEMGPEVLQLLGSTNLMDDKIPNYDKISEQLKEVKKLKLYMTEDTSVGKDLSKIIQKLKKENKIEEMLSIKDSGDNVQFYFNPETIQTNDKEIYLYVQSDKVKKGSSVLLSFVGNFDLSKIN